jgi:hypothetical protein
MPKTLKILKDITYNKYDVSSDCCCPTCYSDYLQSYDDMKYLPLRLQYMKYTSLLSSYDYLPRYSDALYITNPYFTDYYGYDSSYMESTRRVPIEIIMSRTNITYPKLTQRPHYIINSKITHIKKTMLPHNTIFIIRSDTCLYKPVHIYLHKIVESISPFYDVIPPKFPCYKYIQFGEYLVYYTKCKGTSCIPSSTSEYASEYDSEFDSEFDSEYDDDAYNGEYKMQHAADTDTSLKAQQYAIEYTTEYTTAYPTLSASIKSSRKK